MRVREGKKARHHLNVVFLRKAASRAWGCGKKCTLSSGKCYWQSTIDFVNLLAYFKHYI